MPDQTITCPSCQIKIPLTDALSGQIKSELQAEFAQEQRAQLKALEDRERAFAAHQKAIQAAEAKLQEQQKEFASRVQEKVAAELSQEKKKIWVVAQAKAQEAQAVQLKDLQEQLSDQRKKLESAQKQELELLRKARELEDQKKALDLELERKLVKERELIAQKVSREESEKSRGKLQEKDKQIEIMRKTIEDLQRQAAQGSMQIQGEVQEDGLKQLLAEAFPTDAVQDVPAGVRGADLIQVVNGKLSSRGAKILWESKNTKAFSETWLAKLKSDQGLVEADVAILVSRTLPDGVSSFENRSGIWVCCFDLAVPLAMSLRFHLAEVAKLKVSLDGREEKAQLLYRYLSSPQFKNRVENLVLSFVSMQADLETEKRSFQRIWSKREKEIEKMITSTAGLYGDLQGILGGALPTIPQLDLPDDADGFTELAKLGDGGDGSQKSQDSLFEQQL